MAAPAVRPRLDSAHFVLALRLQEATASDLSNQDIVSRLRDALRDMDDPNAGRYCYYLDHFGDASNGDVIYSCNGECMRAPYEISDAAGAAKCMIDMEQAVDVVPRTVYEEEADEEDHYAAMEEAYRRDELYTSLPLYERYISKKERASMDKADFAGKGDSFPIKQPGDIMAAVRAMGRAGAKNLGPSGIKARIISIAKRKGWTKYLPKAWRGDDSKQESAASPIAPGSLKLIESTAWAQELQLIESAGHEVEIKLIAPGKGSSAFYPAEVLKRDAAKFAKNTQIYINHATRAEEAERPEGDWHKLAGALSTDGYWKEGGKHGDGVFAMAKFASDIAPSVIEKAPYSGMSIKANGDAVMEANRPVLRDGVPVLARFTGVESVDVVTRAGAGGMILTEAARPASQSQEVSMTEADRAEIKTLIESALRGAVAEVQKPVSLLEQRALRGDAMVEASRVLGSMSLRESAKAFIVENCTREGAIIPVKDGGALDVEKFKTLVTAEAQRVGAALGDGGRVEGMGPSAAVAIDPQQAALQEAAAKRDHESNVLVFESLGLPKTAAEKAVRGRVA